MPILHVLAGPNGAGKSTYANRVLIPEWRLPFVNADLIAASHWPDAQAGHAYEAAELAEAIRRRLMAARTSFITETVFSHRSKVELLGDAAVVGYTVRLHVLLVPVEVSVQRVVLRVEQGGHDVPEEKIRQRYERLWSHLGAAVQIADEAVFLDNSSARHPFRQVARFSRGVTVGEPTWPVWSPQALFQL
ncbi:MAG: zeta toxin family protein [Marmoricola sp.]